AYQWTPQPQAEAFVIGLVEQFLKADAFSRNFRERLEKEAGVRFSDLVDTVYVQDSTQLRAELERAGFVRNPVSGAGERFVQEKGIFPAVVLHKSNRLRMDLKVESVADSLSIWQVHAEIEGPPLGALRRARITHSDAGELWVV